MPAQRTPAAPRAVAPPVTPPTARRTLLGLAVAVASLGLTVLLTAFVLLQPGTTTLATPVAAAAAPLQPAPPPVGETLRFRSGALDRAVLVQDPLATGPARGVVVVLGPHALTAARTATDLTLSGLREQGFALAFPSTNDGDWNAGTCCGSSWQDQVDDVAFLRETRALLQGRYGTDRFAVVGYSTGGQMAYRLLCSSPGYAEAAVVVAGSMETTCKPEGALPPTLVVHGLLDTTVPWAFTQKRTELLDFAPRPGLTSAAAYAQAAGCTSRVLDRTDSRWLLGYRGCARTPSLTVVGMPTAGHAWSALWADRYSVGFVTRWLR